MNHLCPGLIPIAIGTRKLMGFYNPTNRLASITLGFSPGIKQKS